MKSATWRHHREKDAKVLSCKLYWSIWHTKRSLSNSKWYHRTTWNSEVVWHYYTELVLKWVFNLRIPIPLKKSRVGGSSHELRMKNFKTLSSHKAIKPHQTIIALQFFQTSTVGFLQPYNQVNDALLIWKKENITLQAPPPKQRLSLIF